MTQAGKKWTERNYDGRLRAQCRKCYDARLPVGLSIQVCPDCAERSLRRRSEAQRFRDFLKQDQAG